DFYWMPDYRALRQTLQIVAAFHDIISYIFSFAQLGSAPGCFDYLCPNHLSADWGGTEQIGIELQELQKKIDSLHNPLDPNKVAQMLSIHRQVMLLQFHAAVRHCMREAFLSSGNVSAYQSITDNIYHGLPLISNIIIKSAFGSQLRLPQLLDPHGQRTLMLFPWRSFLANGGPFPVTISNLNPINYSMQLCLCGLNDEDRRVAHGELVRVHFIMDDVLQSHYEAASAGASAKPLKKLPELPDFMASCAFQRSYLILWKQLEMVKAEWGRLKLKVEDINTVPLYKQFSDLYGTEVLYPAMRSIARQRGIEDGFDGFEAASQCMLSLNEASEVEIKTHQLQKLLESLEIHMIHDVQKKINKEMTLVISEKTREGSNLPTELWKHRSMQEIFSVTRPEIAESFIQRLMENHRETETEIAFQKDHLQKCLTTLGCDIMARERRNFETYSMFYENILHQQHQLLYQKEQVFLMLLIQWWERGQRVAELSHEMIMEIMALRARLDDLQEEGHIQKEKIRKEVKEDDEALVQNMFMMCLLLLIHKLSIQNKKECLKSKMMSEHETRLFGKQLKAARKALAEFQAENKRLKLQLDKQEYLLQEAKHKMNQEALKRQQLDQIRTTNLERMLENLRERELSMQGLSEDTAKLLKQKQLEGKKAKREIQQVRTQLTQERSLKMNAFQRVDELQCQLYDLEAATSQKPSSTGTNVSYRGSHNSATKDTYEGGLPELLQKQGGVFCGGSIAVSFTVFFKI
uniref:Uncharacterized protein n=1 Tax=Varanus komodoensis TaxID=61221 RepID=A0A8D2J5N7_VARKO